MLVAVVAPVVTVAYMVPSIRHLCHREDCRDGTVR
jgi:hypothetical protein